MEARVAKVDRKSECDDSVEVKVECVMACWCAAAGNITRTIKFANSVLLDARPATGEPLLMMASFPLNEIMTAHQWHARLL